MSELTDINFDDNLNINSPLITNLVIVYSNNCHRCTKLCQELSTYNIKYSKINIDKNTSFKKKLSNILKLKILSIPVVLLFNNNVFVKKIPNKFPPSIIYLEISNL